MVKAIDYTGKKIGRLSFISYFKNENKKFWNLECDCGNGFTYRADYISTLKNRGSRFECPSCRRKRRLPIELNSKFGRLTVIKEIPGKDKNRWFLCLCECGKYTEVPGVRLCNKRMPTRSCGCYCRKIHSKWANTTQYPPSHGLKKVKNEKSLKTRIYHVRCGILAACYKKEDDRFSIYGAKGVTVCDLWRNGAKEFVEWMLKNGYEKGRAIILKDNKMEFNPSNCIITSKSEYIGKINSKLIEFDSRKQSISAWSRELGCSIACLSKRLKLYLVNYGIEKTMDLEWIPPRKKFCGIEPLELEVVRFYQEGLTFKEITNILGCSGGPIKRFLCKNNIPTRPAKCRSSLT